MSDTIRIAAVQLTSTRDRDHNLAHTRTLMEVAVQRGAQVVALPENFSCMCADEDKLAVAEDIETGPSVGFLRDFAREHAVSVVGGSVPLRVDDSHKVANAYLVVAPSGDILARYDKMHLFDVQVDGTDAYTESDSIAAGDRIVIADVLGVTMGFTICYDVRFPELYRALALRGAQVLFVPAAFTVPTGRDHWAVLLRARAIENSCYVVAIGQVGHHYGDRHTYGHSMIIDPWGSIIAEAGEEPGVIVGDIDMSHLVEMRRRVPSLSNVRSDIFGWPDD